ncbi:hypothetical protein [Streptomyces sp. LN704]
MLQRLLVARRRGEAVLAAAVHGLTGLADPDQLDTRPSDTDDDSFYGRC